MASDVTGQKLRAPARRQVHVRRRCRCGDVLGIHEREMECVNVRACARRNYFVNVRKFRLRFYVASHMKSLRRRRLRLWWATSFVHSI